VADLENMLQEQEIEYEVSQEQLKQQLQVRFEELKKMNELLDNNEKLIRKLKEENLLLLHPNNRSMRFQSLSFTV
jgi:hypothetical protein